MGKHYVFGAVIPAAGQSLRMGDFKPLMPFGDSTVIENTVAAALENCGFAAAVLGKRGGELRALLCERFGERLILAENPDYASTDMLSSLKIGLGALPECDAFFVVPGDMPLIGGDTYRALAEAYDGSAGVWIPLVGERRGHPPLISARLIPDILAYTGGGGLRAALSGAESRLVPVSDSGALADMDTPEDYEKMTLAR